MTITEYPATKVEFDEIVSSLLEEGYEPWPCEDDTGSGRSGSEARGWLAYARGDCDITYVVLAPGMRSELVGGRLQIAGAT